MKRFEIKKFINVIFFVAGFFFLMVTVGSAQPLILSVDGTASDNSVVTINGSEFGTNSSPSPVAWDNLEDGSCNNSATVGSWASVNDLSISTAHQRHANSAYNAVANFTSEKWANFTGGSDSSKWFVQYWFYLDNDFNFSSNIDNNLGNIKIFRMWSTGSGTNNLRVQLLSKFTSDLVVENADENHGGYGTGWTPVTSQYRTINEAFGHSTPSEIMGGDLGWGSYPTDITKGSWHLFQFQYGESSLNTSNGTLKWWIDGKLVTDVNSIKTRTSSQPSSMRPAVVGWYNSHGAGADGSDHFYLDDAYIDNTWARVEIGNVSNYNQCSHREIQIPQSWLSSTITFRANTGSFSSGQKAYLFVIDPNGNPSSGHEITIGGSYSNTPPADSDPNININSPTSSSTYTTDSNSINLAGSASDDIGVSTVAWSNNRGGNGTATYSSGNWSASGISLQSGTNVITVTAMDTAGKTATDSLSVVYDASTPTPAPDGSVWNADSNIGGGEWYNSSVTYCVRILIPGEQITQSGNTIKLGFQGRNSGNYTIRSVSIAERDQNGNIGDVVDSTWKKVTFDKKAETYLGEPLIAESWENYQVVVPQGTEKVSNSIRFDIVQGKDYFVTFKIETPSVYQNPPAGYSELYFDDADHTQNLDWSGTGFGTTQDYHALSNIYITNETVSPSFK